jgi:hypothetical protein
MVLDRNVGSSLEISHTYENKEISFYQLVWIYKDLILFY